VIVMELFEKLVREQRITVVMVTHERSFAARASRRIDMQDGVIISDER
jgi:lipoprotein-releasing system ATP-binding protein